MMVYEWKEKVVLITGAANGIGACVVTLILDEGVKYVAILDTAEEKGELLQIELSTKYSNSTVKFLKCDVTKEDQLFDAFKTVQQDNGHLDVVINNAGILNDSIRGYKNEIELNVTALVTSTLKGLEKMRKDNGGNGGTIINISSVAALCQFASLPIYFATKSAVLQFSNCIGMNDYYLRTGVRVIVICFGATDTGLLNADRMAHFDKQINENLENAVKIFPMQKTESAAKGLLEVYKHGQSGSTWLVNSNKPAEDISGTIQKAYSIMAEHIFK